MKTQYFSKISKKLTATSLVLLILLSSFLVLPPDASPAMGVSAAEDTSSGKIDISALSSSKAVKLPDEFVSQYGFVHQFYNSQQNGIYFLTDNELWFMSLKDGSYTKKFDFKNIDLTSYINKCHPEYSNVYSYEIIDSSYEDFYVLNNKLYIIKDIGYYIEYYESYDSFSKYMHEYMIEVYDLNTATIVNTIPLQNNEDSVLYYSAIGVDNSGNIYVGMVDFLTEDDDKYYISVLNSGGKQLAKEEIDTRIYSFVGFDKNTGDFYTESSYNWVYWGYDHDMHALRKGNFKNGKISVEKNIIQTLGQNSYSAFSCATDMINNKYLCADAPLNATNDLFNPYESGLFVYDVSKINSDPENAIKLWIERDYLCDSNDHIDTSAVYGSRTIASVDGSDNLITVLGNSQLLEINPQTNKSIISRKTTHPVYSLFSAGNKVAAIEIVPGKTYEDNDTFYLQMFEWKKATKMSISATSENLAVGADTKLKAEFDATNDEQITWSSSNNKIASVTNDGTVYAVSPGSAKITAKNSYGLSDSITITVKSNSLEKKTGYISASKGTKTNNLSNNNYYTWSSTVNSNLFQNSDKTLTRVEATDKNIIVETYTSDCKTLKSTKTVKMELSYFGGAYFGKNYNYLVFGQNNLKDSNSVEVVRVVKYSKDWKRLGQTSIKGANTYIPFEAGSLRMTEVKGLLYIYTCHEMYESEDGLHHQANMTFVIDEATMKIKQSYFDMMNIEYGYVSHSFNQFIKTDGTSVYRVDHGDAYPRGITITRCAVDGKITDVSYTTAYSFDGSIGNNYTGASVGGFELGKNNCVIAANSVRQEKFDTAAQRNIFVLITSKNLSNPKTVWLTSYKEPKSQNDIIEVGTPQLVKVNDNIFLVMWEETDKNGSKCVKLVLIDENGNKLNGPVKKNGLALSDCQPILCSDNLVKWYTTNNSSPTFYAINPYNFNIYNYNIASSTVSVSSAVHTGKPVTPNVTVKNGNTTLKKGTDYTVSYKNNTNVGTATVTITGKGSYTGTKTATFKILPAKPTNLKSTRSASAVKLTWNKASGATSYGVYVYDTKAKKYKGLATVTGTSYTVKNLKAGTTYKFAVRSNKKVGGTTFNSSNAVGTVTTKFTKVKSLKATQSTSAVKLSWSKVSGATSYDVYQKIGGKWKRVAATKSTSYTVKKLKAGTCYEFAVRANKKVGRTTLNGQFAFITTATKTATPTMSVKAAGSRRATVTWKKVSGATGYQIYMSTKKNSGYKKVATVSAKKTAKYTKANLKKGKIYYVRVRTYKTVGKAKVYSGYQTKAVKIK